MLRSYQPADLITLGNGAAGMAAILVIMSYLTMPDTGRLYLSNVPPGGGAGFRYRRR